RARRRGPRQISGEEEAFRSGGGGGRARPARRSGPRGSDRSRARAQTRRRTGAREAGRQDEARGARRRPARSVDRLGISGTGTAGSPGIRNDRGLSGDFGESAGKQRSRIG